MHYAIGAYRYQARVPSYSAFSEVCSLLAFGPRLALGQNQTFEQALDFIGHLKRLDDICRVLLTEYAVPLPKVGTWNIQGPGPGVFATPRRTHGRAGQFGTLLLRDFGILLEVWLAF